MSQFGLPFDRMADAERKLVAVVSDEVGESQLLQGFLRFHHDNRHVFDLLVRFARDLRNAGRLRYGMKALVERVRWHVDIETRSADGLKISNCHTAYYARLIGFFDESLAGLFTLRPLSGSRHNEDVAA